MQIVLAGATGFIGRALIDELLRQEHELILLTRDPARGGLPVTPNLRPLKWDGKSQGEWSKWVDGADAVINLTGDSVASGRWTKSKKERIISSRINSTQAIVTAINSATKKPSVLVNASAVGYYGDIPTGDVTEEQAKGQGFLAETCETWEKEAQKVEGSGVRLVLLRIGVVLGKGGGALQKMIPPFFLFAGGPLGSGKQWFPWIHRDDVVGSIVYALDNKNLSGPVNGSAPNPVTMKDFCSALGEVMNRPSWAPVPGFALKVGLGEMATMLLEGQKAIPKKLQDSGYQFKYPNVDQALNSILN